LGAEQLVWLEGRLRQPAPRGHLVVVHHPSRLAGPAASPEFLLRDATALEAVVAGHRGRVLGCSRATPPGQRGALRGTLFATAPATLYQLEHLENGDLTPSAGAGFGLCVVGADGLVVHSVLLPAEATDVPAAHLQDPWPPPRDAMARGEAVGCPSRRRGEVIRQGGRGPLAKTRPSTRSRSPPTGYPPGRPSNGSRSPPIPSGTGAPSSAPDPATASSRVDREYSPPSGAGDDGPTRSRTDQAAIGVPRRRLPSRDGRRGAGTAGPSRESDGRRRRQRRRAAKARKTAAAPSR
jgi:hypothetical protein